MIRNVLKFIFLAGLAAAEGVRAPHRAENSRARMRGSIQDNRVDPVEAGMMTLSSVGIYLLPLMYIFGKRLHFADYQLPRAAEIAAGAAGTAAMAAAVWTLIRAHSDLGRNWSPSLEIKEEHQLVTAGIYAHVRHPIYAAVWLLSLGQALLLHNWLAGPAALLTYAPTYFLRVPREERMMAEHFGAEYEGYRERTGAVLPRM